MSARKNVLASYPIVSNGDMSLTSITSKVTNIQFLDNIGVQLDFTGSPIGTFVVQVSADYATDYLGNVTNAGHWINVNLPQSPVASGSAGDIYIDLNQLSAPYLRVVYTKGSGTGTLNAVVTAKMI
jgi:hypothetical protein